jgi:hypothetical protein
MAQFSCTLSLVRRLWPVVDGEHYHGEIMRFQLIAEPLREPVGTNGGTRYLTVELRISGTLLANRAWDALSAHDVADHGRAFLAEQLQREGLPEHSHHTIVLTEHTEGGAFASGSPYTAEHLLPGRQFVVSAPDRRVDQVSLQSP